MRKLIIAEKPSAAKEIARIVDADKRKTGYYEGSEYIVSWCYGHLIGLAMPEEYSPGLAKWTAESLPVLPSPFQTVVSEKTAKQFDILKNLMNSPDTESLICAADAGREGELIFRLVYEKAGCEKPFTRLWINSLEESAIREGLAGAKPGEDYDLLYKAARSRQRADWLIGINLTRYYTIKFGRKLPAGRVQTPTVNLIVKRQREIEGFIPSIYYVLWADFGSFKAFLKEKDREKADRTAVDCAGETGVVSSIERNSKKENAPALYDLTALQREANRSFGYSAMQTLDYLQSLYENKLTTYPRTDSRYIPSNMAKSVESLYLRLIESGVYPSGIKADYLNISQAVNDKKVSDHHAVLPTSIVTKEALESLPTGEKNILLLVLYRLIIALSPAFKYEETKAIIRVHETEFKASGREITEQGFKETEAIMKSVLKIGGDKKTKETLLPALSEGDSFRVESVSVDEKQTAAPLPYTEDSLLAVMETAGKKIEDPELREAMKEGGLGTPATRATIIENIIHTGYITREKKNLLPTDTAIKFMEIVTPEIKEPDLTAGWEKQLAEIQNGSLCEDNFIREIEDFLKTFMEKERTKSSDNNPAVFQPQRESVGVCPKCGRSVYEYPKGYFCEAGREGCGFVIWKNICGKSVSVSAAKQLLSKNKTGLFKDLRSKAGKVFSAHLTLKSDYTIGFIFPPRQ